MATRLVSLVAELRACKACEPTLPLGARPIFQLDRRALILIASQAPGRVAHEKGRPFDDASGDRLRAWLGVSRDTFYDPACFAILPMGLCFPGKAASGDLPPRAECAPLWRRRALDALPHIRLTLAIGQHALAGICRAGPPWTCWLPPGAKAWPAACCPCPTPARATRTG